MVSFGIMIENKRPVRDTVKLAQAADKAGFEMFWLADENPSPPYRDVWVTYSQVVTNTDRIKVCTGINTPYTRHPALLAVALNTLNELAPGRAHIGIGPGGFLTLHPLGIKLWDRPIRALRETFTIMRRMMAGEKFTFEGDLFQAHDVQLDPITTKWNIWLAARGTQVIKTAGRYADGVFLSVPPDYVRTAKQLMEEQRPKRELPDPVRIGNLVPLSMNADQAKNAREISHTLAFVVPNTPDNVHMAAGISLEDVETVRAAINSEGPAKAATLITPRMIEEYAIAGDMETVLQQVKRNVDAGVEHLVFGQPFDPEDPIGAVQRLGEALRSQYD